MLTNFDLEKICEKSHIQLNGVYMKDQLPKTVQNGNYIINLQSSNGGKNKGTHWTALIIHDQNAFFYDSFGAAPSKEIRQFIKKRKGCHLGFNNWIIQDIHSESCGWYCLALLKNIQHNKNKDLYQAANDFLNEYVNDTKRNDQILNKQVKLFNI